MKNRRGFTLVAAIFILLVMTLLALTTSTYISSDAVIAVKNYHALDAFYIAVSGLEYYTELLENDSDWSTPPSDTSRSFSGGVFVITTTNESKNSITITATAYLTIEGTTYQRSLRPYIIRSGGAGLGGIAGEYAIYWGTGGDGGGGGDKSQIKNNVTIIGGVLVDAELDVGNNVLISGDAYSTDEIDLGNNSTITGTTEEYTTLPADPPSLETTVYDNEIAIAATYPPGNLEYAKNQTYNISGTYYVNGEVRFRQNSTINITGTATIVATERVRLDNNVTIGDNLTIISGDEIDIGNNVVVGSNCLFFASDEIDVGNNIIVGGSGSLEGSSFIAVEEIDFGNNAEYYGLVYSAGELDFGNNTDFHGLIVANYVKHIHNNSVIVGTSDSLQWDTIPGIAGGSGGGESIDVDSWDEVY